MVLTNEGALVAVDLGRLRDARVEVPEHRLGKVTELLSEVCPFEVGDRVPVCADCFTYMLEAEVHGATYRALANDANLPDTGLLPLVMELRTLQAEALSESTDG
jgi:hypothetical protein